MGHSSIGQNYMRMAYERFTNPDVAANIEWNKRFLKEVMNITLTDRKPTNMTWVLEESESLLESGDVMWEFNFNVEYPMMMFLTGGWSGRARFFLNISEHANGER